MHAFEQGCSCLQEAFEKAVVDDPSLVKQFPQLQAAAERASAAQAKERGNQAFAAQQYDTAARHFTDAIALSEDPTFYSNRAAAYQALGEHRKAVKDAKRVVLMDKSWVKGWFRLATAHSSLKEWSEVSRPRWSVNAGSGNVYFHVFRTV